MLMQLFSAGFILINVLTYPLTGGDIQSAPLPQCAGNLFRWSVKARKVTDVSQSEACHLKGIAVSPMLWKLLGLFSPIAAQSFIFSIYFTVDGWTRVSNFSGECWNWRVTFQDSINFVSFFLIKLGVLPHCAFSNCELKSQIILMHLTANVPHLVFEVTYLNRKSL